jgi:transposase
VPPLNRYYRRARISEAQFRAVLRCFALDLTATQAAATTGLSVRATNALYLKLRRRIAAWCEAAAPFAGQVEIDESYFGPRRVRGQRGRGAGRKVVVVGLYKRNGSVFTQVVTNLRQATLRAILLGRVALGSAIHSDQFAGYDGVVALGYAKHYRVQHSANEFVRPARGGRPKQHINGIESFWSAAKRRLAKFNGVARHTFYLHLKETEWRFNHRRMPLYRLLLQQLRTDPL